MKPLNSPTAWLSGGCTRIFTPILEPEVLLQMSTLPTPYSALWPYGKPMPSVAPRTMWPARTARAGADAATPLRASAPLAAARGTYYEVHFPVWKRSLAWTFESELPALEGMLSRAEDSRLHWCVKEACGNHANDNQATTYTHEGTGFIVFTNREPTPGVVAHEVFHYVSQLLSYVGMHLTDASEECYAYHLQFLIDKVEESKNAV